MAADAARIRPVDRRVDRRLLATTAKAVSRALDDSLVAAGGSMTTWLVLLAVRSGGILSQRELAHAIGIEGPH